MLVPSVGHWVPLGHAPPLVTLPAAAKTVSSSGFTTTARTSRLGGSTKAAGETFCQLPTTEERPEQSTGAAQVPASMQGFCVSGFDASPPESTAMDPSASIAASPPSERAPEPASVEASSVEAAGEP